MNRFLVLPLTLLCCACAGTVEKSGRDGHAGPVPASPIRPALLGPYTWFHVASYMRRCHGHDSPRGAQFAAAAAGLGVLYFFRKAPRSKASGAAGRQRAIALMFNGYRGRNRGFNPSGVCRTVVRLIATYYRRESRKDRRLLSKLAISALKSDRAGQTFLAQMRIRGRRGARRPVQQRRRFRRAILKPSEQQLPIGE